MQTDQHIPISPTYHPRLLTSTRSTSSAVRSSLSPRSIRLARGIYWEPAQEAKRWEHRLTLSLARAQVAHMTQSSAICLTHASAALHLGLAMYSKEPDVYVAVPKAPKEARTALPIVRFPLRGDPYPSQSLGMDRRIFLLRRHLALNDDELVVVGGMPMTHALRTAFDCAFDEPAHNALAIADSALRLVCRPERDHPERCRGAFQEARTLWGGLLARHGRRRRISQARAILNAAHPLAESPMESVMRWFILALGLEPPTLQHRIDIRDRSVWVDLCWPQYRLVIEVDGRSKYTVQQDAWKEKLRQDAISELSWRVLRVTSQELYDLPRLSERVLSAFPPGVVAARSPRLALLWPGAALEDGLSSASLILR